MVARANELLGPASGSRSPDELARLWQALVADYSADAASSSPPDAPPRAPVDDPAHDIIHLLQFYGQ